MRHILLGFVSFLCALTVVQAENIQLNTMTLTEGTVVEVDGVGFGTNPGKFSQVCFSDTLCSAVGSLQQVVLSWSDTHIQLQIPKVAIPEKGVLSISAYPNGDTNASKWFTSGAYTFTPSQPIVSKVTPDTVVAEKTIVLISGKGFGQSYISGKTQICIRGACLADDIFLASYLISWSDTEVKMKVPAIGIDGPASLTMNIWKYTDRAVGGEVYFPVNTTILFEVLPDPQIRAVSSATLIPEQTLLTIEGIGFGESYVSGKQQLCFGTGCIPEDQMKLYLVSWSDTSIQVKIPAFVNEQDTVQIFVRTFIPSKNIYSHIVFSPTLVVVHIPDIGRYFTSMESDTVYQVKGKYFGAQQGTVMIGNVTCEIISWEDGVISFRTPLQELASDLHVINTKGLPSVGVPVTVRYVPKISQDAYSQYQDYLQTLGVVDAWKITKGSPDVVVAVIDGGIDTLHEDMRDAIWVNKDEIPNNGRDDDHNGYVDDVHGWDFVTNTPVADNGSTHGTMVGSVIAAKQGNRKGLTGVAPQVKLMSLSAMVHGQGGKSDTIDVDASIAAMKYAIQNGAKIITVSFGGPYTDAYDAIVQYAYDNNVLVVAAAGNEHSLLSAKSLSPLCNNQGGDGGVVGISALGKNGKFASFANMGACVDFIVPGEQIVVATRISDDTQDPYSFADGTSFSTPLFAGMAALVWSYHPDWNVREVITVLESTAVSPDKVDPSYSNLVKYGIPNVYQALLASRPKVTYVAHPGTLFTHKNTQETILIDAPSSTPISQSTAVTSKNVPTLQGGATFTDLPSTSVYAQAVAYLKERSIVKGYEDGTFRPDAPINRAEYIKILLTAQGIIPSVTEYHDCFPDVQKEWYAPYVCFAKSHMMIMGYPDGKFRPEQMVNRAEAVKMFVTNFGAVQTSKVTFTDVPVAAWYASYIATAEAWHVLSESPYSKFYPSEFMKRGPMCSILYAYLKGK